MKINRALKGLIIVIALMLVTMPRTIISAKELSNMLLLYTPAMIAAVNKASDPLLPIPENPLLLDRGYAVICGTDTHIWHEMRNRHSQPLTINEMVIIAPENWTVTASTTFPTTLQPLEAFVFNASYNGDWECYDDFPAFARYTFSDGTTQTF